MKKIFSILLLAFLTIGAVQAQEKTSFGSAPSSYYTMTWNVTFPMGDFHDWVSEASMAGFDFGGRFIINLKKYYPDIYHRHVEERIEFVYEKMWLNIQKGIRQGMYRDDLSVELITRLYIRRLMDIHNPDFFPAEKFSFQTLFDVMFDHFIRGIATQEGIAHYEAQKNKVNFKQFEE